MGISIHALLAESDSCFKMKTTVTTLFLSTLSLRRATRCAVSDATDNVNFYPRSPCGERRWGVVSKQEGEAFLSTLSLRRATVAKIPHTNSGIFLSTLSLRRATIAFLNRPDCVTNFYPRSPCGERRRRTRSRKRQKNFYPRSPCGERRYQVGLKPSTLVNFYPRSPCGERLVFSFSHSSFVVFLSTLSLRRATI